MSQQTVATRGFTMFFSVLVASLTLAIGVAIYDLVVRQLALSSTVDQSQYAVYAADTGAECALYWDSRCNNSTGISACYKYGDGANWGTAFATSSSFLGVPANSGLNCSALDISSCNTSTNHVCSDGNVNTGHYSVVANTPTSATTTISFLLSGGACTDVTIEKWVSGGVPKTKITSNGYNTCNTAAPNRVQRSLQLNY